MPLFGDPDRNKHIKQKVFRALTDKGNNPDPNLYDTNDETEERLGEIPMAPAYALADMFTTCSKCGALLMGSGVVGNKGVYCGNKCMRRNGDSN